MAKQKQDNKTVDIELLILRDKIECLIDEYELLECECKVDKKDKQWCNTILDDLKGLLDSGFTDQQKKETK